MKDQQNPLPFDRSNYRWMLIGVVVLLAGFIIMSLDKEEFGFGFLGLTLGPLVLFVGFAIEYYAILHKSKADQKK
jgi:ABC-type transport system involved in cytochrome c biogenesis permease subunit